jgi:serralysin
MIKQRYLLLITALSLAQAACTSTTTTTSTSPNGCRTAAHGAQAPLHMCEAQNFSEGDFRAPLPVKLYVGPHKNRPVAAGFLSLRWPDGRAVKVGFMDDDFHLRNKVLHVANEWHTRGNANISFVESSVNDADVRVSFHGTGYWSYIGTQARHFPKSEQTLNLQFGPNESDTEIHRVVLHEFGHALGLIHEHESPLAQIPWNKPEVYKFFGAPPNCWSHQQVDIQVLTKEPPSPDLPATTFDRDSIMEYPVAASLTTDHREIGWNTDLSETDKTFIAKLYP